MIWIVLIISWLLCGFCLYGFSTWHVNKQLTVRDLIDSLLASIIGPLAVVFLLKIFDKNWIDKRIF